MWEPNGLMKSRFCQEDNAGAATPPCPLGSAALQALRDDLRLFNGLLNDFNKTMQSIRSEVLAAYPLNSDGKPDIAGHRSYHESLIDQAKARTEFWRKLLFEITKWGLIGFIAWGAHEIVLLVIQWAKSLR